MGRIHLAERKWQFIRLLVPPPARTGPPRADDRRTIEGILYVLITGCRWQDLPREYGAPTTVWDRLKRWGEAGGVGAHLAGSTRRPRPTRQARLVEGLSRWLLRTRQEGR
jgi:transposase